jgi:hypothetical protein
VYIRERGLVDILDRMGREGAKVIYVSPKADAEWPAFREGVESRRWESFSDEFGRAYRLR